MSILVEQWKSKLLWMFLEASSQCDVWQMCIFTVLFVQQVKGRGKFCAVGDRRCPEQNNCIGCFGNILWYGHNIQHFITTDVGESADVSVCM